jgi:iron(III) transport system ATP-binding protein
VAGLRCEHVAASYGARVVLRDIDLVVPESSVTAILGASGCGKTTLLRVIMGFERPRSGRVFIGDTVVSDPERRPLAPEKRGIGYVAQEGALYPHLNVAQNVTFGLPRSGRKDSHRIAELLSLVGLSEEHAGRRASELSGGEQRRVSLARALAPRPKVVLLDEPFSGLDAALRVETRRAVLRALRREGTTAVLVTHDQAEALSMGDQVAVLSDGHLVQTGSPSELYRNPVDLGVANFVGDAVVLPGYASEGTVSCALGTLPLLDGHIEGPVDAMLRPEQIRLEPCGGELPPQCPSGQVTGSTYLGSDTLIELKLNNSTQTLVAKSYSYQAPAPGDTVRIVVVGPAVAYPRKPPATGDGPTDPAGQRGMGEAAPGPVA